MITGNRVKSFKRTLEFFCYISGGVAEVELKKEHKIDFLLKCHKYLY